MPACAPPLLELLKTLTPVLAAAAAALIAVIGWSIKSLVQYLAWLFVRRQQRIDLMAAIEAEIETNLSAEARWASEQAKNDFLEKFDGPHGVKGGLIPYAASTNEPPIIAELTKQFFLLPPEAGKAVFGYFNLSQGLDAQIKDFRSETFRQIGTPRQRVFIAATFDLAAETCKRGRKAKYILATDRKRQIFWQWSVPTLTGLALFVCAAWLMLAAPRLTKKLFSRAAGWVATCSAPSMPPAISPAAHP